MNRSRIATLLLWAAVASCSLTTGNNFKECNADSDCASFRACAQNYCVDLPAGCSQKFGDLAAPLDSRLTIGALFPLSQGGVTDVNEALRVKALSFAVDEINTGPAPVDGRRVIVYACDDLNDNGVTAAQATWFADALKAPALIVSRTQGTNAAYDAVAGKDVLILSPNATADELTAYYRASGGLLWRLAPPDTKQTQVLLNLLGARVDAGQVALVHRGGNSDAGRDPYGAGIDDAFTRLAGGKVNSVPYAPESLDAAAVAASLATYNPQATVFVGFPAELRPILEAVSKIKSLQADAGHRVFFTDSAKKPTLLVFSDAGIPPLVQELLKGAVGTAPAQRNAINPAAPNGPGCCSASYTAFRNHFFAEYNTEPDETSFTTHSYDAVWLLRFAAAAFPAGTSMNGTRLRIGLERIIPAKSDGGQYFLSAVGVGSALNELSNGASVDIEGASSSLRLDFDSGFASTPYEIWHVGDAGFYTERHVSIE